jgi:hypothetical protein
MVEALTKPYRTERIDELKADDEVLYEMLCHKPE